MSAISESFGAERSLEIIPNLRAKSRAHFQVAQHSKTASIINL